MDPIEQQLTTGFVEVKGLIAKRDEEVRNLGTTLNETKATLESAGAKLLAMQTQIDAIDQNTQHRHAGPSGGKSIGDMLVESPKYLERKGEDFSGRAPVRFLANASIGMSQKTAVTNSGLGTGTSGVLMPVRMPGVVGLAQQALRIRDVMNVVTQDAGNSFDYVYQSTRNNNASPQVEASAKNETTLNWQSQIGNIRTIAHWTNVSKQALADAAWVRNTIDNEMEYGLKVKEEAEILSGDGTGEHLNGIITQATAFDTTLLSAVAGWTRLDILRWAKLQARLAGLATYAPTAFVLHPTDLAHLELTKDAYGHYIIGDPRTGVEVDMVWKLPVVESDSIASGTFLVGAFATAAQLRDRQQVSTEISFENNDNFTKNMATILCEERIGLAVTKAGAFIKGSFTTSPANQ